MPKSTVKSSASHPGVHPVGWILLANRSLLKVAARFLRDVHQTARLWLRAIALVAMLGVVGGGLSACVTAQSREVLHGLYFDVYADGQNVEILAHRYGPKNDPIIWNPTPSDVGRGPMQEQRTSGGYRVGEELYVKWRDKATNKVYEETFILKGKLPVDMNGVRITFLIRENRMVVYVVLDAARIRTEPYDGPSIFQHSRVLKLN